MPLSGASGSRIGYEVHDGPAGAPPLLLLHGFTASSACWVSNIPGLTDRFTVITADLLGHGGSDAPDDPALYGPDAAVSRLLNLLDDLGHEQALVCGHSLGGALALRLALDAPERVAGLVILNSNSAAGTPEWRETARTGMTAMAAKARAEGTAFLRETRLYPASGSRLPQEARALLTRDFERLTPAGFAGTAEALVIDVNAFERLSTLQTPTLVMIGDRDADFVQSAPRFIVRMPHDLVDTFTIEGAGHAANLEQPELFNEALFAFAERIGYLPGDDADTAGVTTPLPFPLAAADDEGGPPYAELGDSEDDFDLGPSLYEEFGETLRSRGRQLALTSAGFGLVAVGVGLLVAAFFVGGDDNNGTVAAGDDSDQATATPTIIEQAAGVKTAGPASPTPVASAPAAAQATPSPTTASPTAVAVTGPPDEPDDEPTDEPEPTQIPADTPTPEPTPPPTATSTPTGPWVTISGPATAGPGDVVSFASVESNGAIRRDWSASNGATLAHAASFATSFDAPGCYSVTVTALFPSGPVSTTQTVAVGGASCG
jgi:pimeloyl-ACP methyl ester carboxylesterase